MTDDPQLSTPTLPPALWHGVGVRRGVGRVWGQGRDELKPVSVGVRS